MPAIHETRRLPIRERIITLENVRALARILRDEYEKLDTKEALASLSFHVACADGSSFQSEDIALFDSDSIVSRKRVVSVDLELRNYKTSSKIEITMAHGNSDYRNGIVIMGEDGDWVNGKLKSIEETISSFLPQQMLLYQYASIARLILALGFGSLYMWFVFLIPVEPSPDKPLWVETLNSLLTAVPLGQYLFKYLLAFSAGYFPAFVFVNKLKSLWPSIEIQIGPEHTYVEKRRRLWLVNAVILGVLPFVTSLIYDVVKTLLVHHGD